MRSRRWTVNDRMELLVYTPLCFGMFKPIHVDITETSTEYKFEQIEEWANNRGWYDEEEFYTDIVDSTDDVITHRFYFHPEDKDSAMLLKLTWA